MATVATKAAFDQWVFAPDQRQQLSIAPHLANTSSDYWSKRSVSDRSIKEVATLAVRYLDHGLSPVPRIIGVRPDGHIGDLPMARARVDECQIWNIRARYTPEFEDTERLSAMIRTLDDRLVRAGVLIHEDTHCRVNPFLPTASDSENLLDALKTQLSRLGSIVGLKTGEQEHRKQVEEMAMHIRSVVNENIADSMMLLMIAHKDGVRAALDLATLFDAHWRDGFEGVTAETGKDGTLILPDVHDTSGAIELVRKHLLSEKGAPASPGEAFEVAVRIGTEAGIDAADRHLLTSLGRLGVGTASESVLDALSDYKATLRAGVHRAVLAYENPEIVPSRVATAIVMATHSISSKAHFGDRRSVASAAVADRTSRVRPLDAVEGKMRAMTDPPEVVTELPQAPGGRVISPLENRSSPAHRAGRALAFIERTTRDEDLSRLTPESMRRGIR